MAQANNTFDRYDVGNNVREDLSDIIYNISPTEVPAQSNFGRGTSQQTYKEWQIDVLTAAAENAHVDGDEFAGELLSKAARVGNYHQISRKDLVISRRANIVNKAGRKAEVAYQIAKLGKELRRDVEFSICARHEAVPGSVTVSNAGAQTAAVAMQAAGIPSWIITNATMGSTASGATSAQAGTKPTMSVAGPPREGYPNAAGTVGTPAIALTESSLLNTVRNCYQQGGNPNMVMVPPTLKQGLSNYLFTDANARVATQYQEQGSNPRSGITVVGAVDVYVTDFSVIDIVPNRFQADSASATEVFVLDTEYWEVSYLDGYKTETIAKIGDHERRMLLVDWTLCSKNEAASGVIAGINNGSTVAS